MASDGEVVFRDDTQCFVRDLAYDFRAKVGVLYLEDGSCTDMRGCIGLFKKIDADVRTILTIAGLRRDTAYLRDDDGAWRAVVAPGERAAIHGDWWHRAHG